MTQQAQPGALWHRSKFLMQPSPQGNESLQTLQQPGGRSPLAKDGEIPATKPTSNPTTTAAVRISTSTVGAASLALVGTAGIVGATGAKGGGGQLFAGDALVVAAGAVGDADAVVALVGRDTVTGLHGRVWRPEGPVDCSVAPSQQQQHPQGHSHPCSLSARFSFRNWPREQVRP